MKIALTIVPILVAISLQPAFAASSAWTKVEGGAVRVVTAGLPDQNGVLKGALEIDLQPGWKTYWRDPGDAGIPPMVSVAQTEGSVEIEFPVPQRFDDGYSIWAGYKDPVTLPLTFQLHSGASKADVSVFLGICEEICIPVQADYSIDLERDSAMDTALVQTAFAALPKPAFAGYEAALKFADTEKLMVDVILPGGPDDAQLFVASSENWQLGTPVPVNGKAGSYEIPVLVAPGDASATAAQTIHYTLVGPDGAVSGTFDIKL